MSTQTDPNEAGQSVPAKLRQLAEQGTCVWYEVPAEELARAIYSKVRLSFVEGAVEFDSLLEPVKEHYRKSGMAAVEVLSGYVSRRFAEMEMYGVAMYQVVLALRGMAGESGKLMDSQSGTVVDIEKVLGWERPAPFAALYDRLTAVFDKARLLSDIRAALERGRAEYGAPGEQRPAAGDDQDRAAHFKLEGVHDEAVRELLELVGALDGILSPAPDAAPTPEQPGTPKLVASSSSMIAAYAYDARARRLYVQWRKPGKNPPYGVYANVGEDVYAGFERAESKGKYVLKVLAPNRDGFPYEYLDQLPFSE